MQKRVILLSGRQGSGKTTIAKVLEERVGATTLKFAGPLYEMHEAIAKGAPLVVFDDCRFPNEIEAFGGRALKVRLEAPTEVRAARAAGWSASEHPSEAALDEYDDFNLTLSTASLTPHQCVESILHALQEAPYAFS